MLTMLYFENVELEFETLSDDAMQYEDSLSFLTGNEDYSRLR